MGIEFGEDFRLLADIGWQPEDKRKSVDPTMEAHDLTELLTRLRGEAEGVLDGTAGSFVPSRCSGSQGRRALISAPWHSNRLRASRSALAPARPLRIVSSA